MNRRNRHSDRKQASTARESKKTSASSGSLNLQEHGENLLMRTVLGALFFIFMGSGVCFLLYERIVVPSLRNQLSLVKDELALSLGAQTISESREYEYSVRLGDSTTTIGILQRDIGMLQRDLERRPSVEEHALLRTQAALAMEERDAIRGLLDSNRLVELADHYSSKALQLERVYEQSQHELSEVKLLLEATSHTVETKSRALEIAEFKLAFARDEGGFSTVRELVETVNVLHNVVRETKQSFDVTNMPRLSNPDRLTAVDTVKLRTFLAATDSIVKESSQLQYTFPSYFIFRDQRHRWTMQVANKRFNAHSSFALIGDRPSDELERSMQYAYVAIGSLRIVDLLFARLEAIEHLIGRPVDFSNSSLAELEQLEYSVDRARAAYRVLSMPYANSDLAMDDNVYSFTAEAPWEIERDIVKALLPSMFALEGWKTSEWPNAAIIFPADMPDRDKMSLDLYLRQVDIHSVESTSTE